MVPYQKLFFAEEHANTSRSPLCCAFTEVLYAFTDLVQSKKMSELSEDQSPVSDNAGMDISPGPPWKQGKPIVDSDDDEVAAAVGNLSISAVKKLQVCVHAVVCMRWCACGCLRCACAG